MSIPSLYKPTTLYLALMFPVPKQVVYIDGRLYHLKPNLVSREDWDARERQNGQTRAEKLAEPRGSYLSLTIDPDATKVYVNQARSGNEIDAQQTVHVWRDIVWLWGEPGDAKLSTYAYPRVTPLATFAQAAIHTNTYSLLDGQIIHSLQHPGLMTLKDDEKKDPEMAKLLRGAPDVVQAYNYFGITGGHPVQKGEVVHQVGTRWAFTNRDVAMSAVPEAPLNPRARF